MVNSWRALAQKRFKLSILNFAHTFPKTTTQNRARVFSNNDSFIFYCINSTSFESVFCMKTVKSRLFKKYLKKWKLRALFCWSFAWLNISEKRIIELYNSVSAGTHKVGKVISLWPSFDPNSSDLESVQRVNYIY